MATTAGIDIGSEAIRGVVLHAAKQGAVEVIAAGTLPIHELGQMEDSPDKNLAIGVKLKELVRSARLRAQTRRVGVAGKAASIRYIQIPPVPPWRLDMLVTYEVQERAGEREVNTYDYRILDVPEAGGQYTVMIGMLRESAATELLAMGKSAGLGAVEIDLEAVALYSAYYHGHGFDADKTVLIADVGADDLTILLCRNGSLYFARTVVGAGQRFTQVLAEELKMDPPEAEELKKSQAEITFDLGPGQSRGGRMTRGPGATGILPRPGAPGVLRSGPRPKLDQPAAPETAAAPAASSAAPAAPEAAAASEAAEAAPAANGDAQQTVITGSPFEGLPPAVASKFPPLPLETVEEKRRRQISAALVKEAAGLCAALENAVLVSKQQTKLREIKVDRIYLTGGGSRLKGLQEFMSRRMRMEVMPLEPFRNLSLSRLPPDQAAALKAEQHTLAVATGLALADLRPGAFQFLLLPEAVRQRQTFWARGAYLYYAAALVVLGLALFLFTPYRNADMLATNFNRSEDAVGKAQQAAVDLKKLGAENEEVRNRLKQIADNTMSGHYFLTLLAELKSTKRISSDIYLTQVSTNLPEVVRKVAGTPSGPATEARGRPVRPPNLAAATGRPDALGAEPDTFQTQRRVYLRGFARGDEHGEARILKIKEFYRALVPYPDEPENPANLFKDVRPVWFSTEEFKQGSYHLTEFVLEAYTEGTRDEKAKKPPTPPKATATRVIGEDTVVSPAAPQAKPAAEPAAPGAPVAPAKTTEPAKAVTKTQPAPAEAAPPAAEQPKPADGGKKMSRFVLPSQPRGIPPAPAKKE